MKNFIAAVLLLTLVVPSFAKTHKDVFNVPCSQLWPAVKDTLRNSGKYGIIAVDNAEMTASYNIGGFMGGKRINSVMLNTKGNDCEMQTQTSFSGLAHDDAGDFKKRVEESLAKLKSQPVEAAKAEAAKPEAAKPEPGKPEAAKADPSTSAQTSAETK